MKKYRIKGLWYTVKASCLKDAIRKLVTPDESEIKYYTPHWYTRINKKSWAEVETTYGYKCIIEEV